VTPGVATATGRGATHADVEADAVGSMVAAAAAASPGRRSGWSPPLSVGAAPSRAARAAAAGAGP